MADSKRSDVNLDNIQGSIWPRLPHYYETFLFFKIQEIDAFKTHLKSYAHMITTGAECKKYFERAVDDEIPQARRGIPRVDIPPEKRERFEAVNISFSYKGIEKLVMQYRGNKLDDELHIKGMYKDLVFEGPDDPGNLAREYKPPPDQSSANDSWRVDGLFIVTGQTKDKLDDKVKEVKAAFKDHDTGSASVEIAFEKNGNLRNADGKAKKAEDGKVSLHGKEHFGFEDEISQPQIQGLDVPKDGDRKDDDREYDDKSSIPPGWIITGLKGDKAAQPAWATEGSFLVFREIEEKVPEFNNFVKIESQNMSSFNNEKDEKRKGEKLAAYLMGRWKNGSPVELDPEGDKPEHIFANNFDFDHRRSRAKNTKCPFAAHIRKMRPRADLYIEADDSDDSDDEEVIANQQVINSNVIIRRSITFGPEVDETEEKENKTKNERGIYFLCYQSSIRNGFNFLVTRWASNNVFPPNKGIDKGPGVDPFISQRNRPDHPEGHVSIYNKPDDEQPHTVQLGFLDWINQKGGEYFFTPSIEALKTTISDE